jgi:penicillin amidase
MYGDAKGNIAWWATGKLYKHNDGVDSFYFGWFLWKDDITEYMDFSKNPSAVNPEWNFVYSANNQAEAVDGFYILVIIFQKTELKLPSY